MGAWKRDTTGAPMRGLVGRAGSTSIFDLDRRAPSNATGRFVDHADLAVRLGWYDQAHFINDFRTMLGSTPGEYAAAHGS